MSQAPKISFSICVNTDLSIELHINGGKLPVSSVLSDRAKNGTYHADDGRLSKWSQLNILITYCQGMDAAKYTNTDLLNIIVENGKL